MRYTYLIINILTVFFPFGLSFDKKVHFYKSWKYIWPGMAITGLFFLFWDVLFTMKGVWSFNPQYIVGVTIWGLPLEEVLFFLTVPFACIFIYACLNYYVKWQIDTRLTNIISSLVVMFSVLGLIFYYNKIYTAITFGLLLALVLMVQYVIKAEWLSWFYAAYVVALLPFYIVNGILTAIPVVIYNNSQNMGKRVGTIPVEDHFYLMALLLMNIGFFEYFKARRKTND
ncbi:lycopene cyclase domain-containing protein [Mucilaginibacter ginsenosidivorax]|uniref:Lycopene cyclase domain-containing protein n=1 Tax=Mucilaginibacter ginsenosidivorax TaxID=862126 RepID=A0A5B8VZK3_9SPHI|nr:lycopene cyclase domain-containing protein [Mucilaginibacter ginsenosidivorax]QEC75976.1 lycopene cyclase domain-containing protein [Mucilaginibacter ginsenosidivorax]